MTKDLYARCKLPLVYVHTFLLDILVLCLCVLLLLWTDHWVMLFPTAQQSAYILSSGHFSIVKWVTKCIALNSVQREDFLTTFLQGELSCSRSSFLVSTNILHQQFREPGPSPFSLSLSVGDRESPMTSYVWITRQELVQQR